jgi:hypothetical protein
MFIYTGMQNILLSVTEKEAVNCSLSPSTLISRNYPISSSSTTTRSSSTVRHSEPRQESCIQSTNVQKQTMMLAGWSEGTDGLFPSTEKVRRTYLQTQLVKVTLLFRFSGYWFRV